GLPSGPSPEHRYIPSRCTVHTHVGTSLPSLGGVRPHPLAPGPVGISTLASLQGPGHQHTTRTVGSAQSHPSVPRVCRNAAGFDLQRPAPTAPVGKLAGHGAPRLATRPLQFP